MTYDSSGLEHCVAVEALMQGTVVSIEIGEGDVVRPGQVLLIMNAMKMEHVVEADVGGIVRCVTVKAGDTVAQRHPLIFIEAQDVDAGDTEGSAVFQIYEAFASEEDSRAMRAAFARGISWSDAKQALFEVIDAAISPMRQHYEDVLADPARVEQRLQEGAVKARALATPFLGELRHAVGVRNLVR